MDGSIRPSNMKILIIGSGGREHAIAWALKKTATVPLNLYCAPGNAGIAESAKTVAVSISDYRALAQFVRDESIDLTFVGPEAPLVGGLVDYFESENLPIVGPSAASAQLEGSKVFAKDFMARNNVPTAAYRVAQTPQQAIEYLRRGEFGAPGSPVVVKADGLAAGKGVVVAASRAEAERAIEDLMVNHLAGAEAAARIVLEEALFGVEASLLLFADGRDYLLMPPARDHKRIGENDTGPNTGGMGCITDQSILSDNDLQRVVAEIVNPTLAGAAREGFAFKGILFLGLMLTNDGPKLLEYNVRFGDPETQAILVRLKTDLASILDGIRRESLSSLKIDWTEGASACVVAANRGYPGKYESGALIEGLETVKEAVQVFHAGTAPAPGGGYLATGGRVLGVTSAALNLSEALANCYGALDEIHWPGIQFRRDIGRTHRN
jgi:phosphoribosylamine--glycine ligase